MSTSVYWFLKSWIRLYFKEKYLLQYRVKSTAIIVLIVLFFFFEDKLRELQAQIEVYKGK